MIPHQPGFTEMCVEVFLRSGDAALAAEAASLSLKCLRPSDLFQSKLGRVFSLNMPDIRAVITAVSVVT
jgi:hypothetical protein